MYKTILFSLLSTIFIGCSTTAFKHFENDEINSRSLQYTQKGDIISNEKEQKVLFWATYLNNDKKHSLNKERFLITTYFVNSKSHNLLEKNYTLTMNDKRYIDLIEIDKNNKVYSSLLKTRPWGTHYIVEFKNIHKDYKILLKLQDLTTSNSVQLKFEK